MHYSAKCGPSVWIRIWICPLVDQSWPHRLAISETNCADN